MYPEFELPHSILTPSEHQLIYIPRISEISRTAQRYLHANIDQCEKGKERTSFNRIIDLNLSERASSAPLSISSSSSITNTAARCHPLAVKRYPKLNTITFLSATPKHNPKHRGVDQIQAGGDDKNGMTSIACFWSTVPL